MHRTKQFQKLEAFSLFELLVTMGILLILATIVFPITVQKAQKTKLETYASQLATDIYFQQQESHFKNTAKGLKIENNRYILFDGGSFATGTETDTKTFPGNISMNTISFTVNNEIIFPQGEFKPSSYGTLIITDGVFSIQVYLNQEGLIGYENL